jgi:general stress protein 26
MKETAGNVCLATCDGDTPAVRWMAPIVEDDLAIWVTTRASSNKVKQIRKNPKVCLLFADPPSGEREACVQGKAELVPDLATRKRVWGLATFNLLDHFPDGPESPDFCVLRVLPEEIRWRESWASDEKLYKPGR